MQTKLEIKIIREYNYNSQKKNLNYSQNKHANINYQNNFKASYKGNIIQSIC